MGEIDEERLRQEAADWFARLRGPRAKGACAELDAWRDQSPEHQDAYDRMARHWEATAGLLASTRAGLRTRPPQRRAAMRRVLTGSIAAGLVAAVGLAVWLSGFGSAWGPGATQRYASPVGEIRTIALADGQSLILDTDSVASRRREDGRTVLRLERGRARVQATSAITLEAAGTRVQARNGAVDLTLTPDKAVTIAAVSGQAEVGERRIALGPGQQVIFASGQVARPAPSAIRDRDWPKGLAVFDGARLSDVLALAGRYGGPRLSLADPSLGELKVSGAFQVTRPEPLARALAAAFGLSVGKAPDGRLILSRVTT
uniref:Putative FecR n=1 Tax=Caulobacter sp. (strain K31) TaxID=366602 RepID=B0T9D3_CAUSK